MRSGLTSTVSSNLPCLLKVDRPQLSLSCLQGSYHHGGERGGRRSGCWNPPPHQPAGDEEAAGAAAAAGGGVGGGPSRGGGQRPGRGGDLAARHAPNQSLRGHAGSH